MILLRRRINFYDCDPAGILFYANIFRMCHSAYEKLVSTFELKKDYWRNDEFAVPIIKSSADYIKPFKSGDEINIQVSVSDLRESSFELTYKCTNQFKDFCAEVKTVHVFVDKKSWQKANLLSEIVEGLKSHQTASE
ncbi:acyl-CoA thioesterase [bacterium BMS3Abin03]|jgi:YbgC/YbaW family acyl-CoA thioester hydrolase|nr:acyl-CoA thioesterase [bacterium BMS3Abin03]MCG6958789.1 acyl-CoA thioesterase [bacterium BMS3Abin03]